MTINTKFRDSVTSLAFHLTLSKAMVVMLTNIADQCHSSRMVDGKLKAPDEEFDNREQWLALGCARYDFVTTGRALEARGLIHSPHERWPGIYELTEAGNHVFELLKLAGMVELVQIARQAA